MKRIRFKRFIEVIIPATQSDRKIENFFPFGYGSQISLRKAPKTSSILLHNYNGSALACITSGDVSDCLDDYGQRLVPVLTMGEGGAFGSLGGKDGGARRSSGGNSGPVERGPWTRRHWGADLILQ